MTLTQEQLITLESGGQEAVNVAKQLIAFGQHRFDDAIEAMDRLEIENARLAQERNKWKLAAETTNVLLKDIF